MSNSPQQSPAQQEFPIQDAIQVRDHFRSNPDELNQLLHVSSIKIGKKIKIIINIK